ncbi:KH domain-containing protein [Candidatus Woesearchaeota archaeon]|nr:KH domain-containing protein [Candidatus Woesearchaeota archaeon]
MEEGKFSYEVKIPKERVAILIGKNGEVKEKIETETKTKIKINSDDGDVFIVGTDAIYLFCVREIIKAIGRGFNPEIALLLLKSDYALEIIRLVDYNRHKNHMLRLKGRVIGTRGKSRKYIESMTDTYVSVYGKTICILGRNENVLICKRAIESLLEGSPHSSVFKWLEKQQRELSIRRISGEDEVQLKDKFIEEKDNTTDDAESDDQKID